MFGAFKLSFVRYFGLFMTWQLLGAIFLKNLANLFSNLLVTLIYERKFKKSLEKKC
jgi:hypothetical protein